MRKIVLVILCFCVLIGGALTAFASTDGEGQMYYTPIPFDTISGITATGSIASRFEWLFGFGQMPTDNIVYFSLGAPGYSSQVRDGEYYGQINMTRTAGLDGFLNLPLYPEYQLRASNVVVKPYALDGLKLSLYNMPNTIITECTLTVSAQNITVNSAGQLQNNPHSTTATFAIYGSTLNIGTLLHQCLARLSIYNSDVMFLTSVYIEFGVETEDADKLEFRVQCPFDYLDTEQLGFASYLRTITVDLPSDSLDFNVGTFLGDSVSAFLNTPIYDTFSLGDLFGIALTLGVLFFALKLLV